MMNENTEKVVAQKETDLKLQAKNQLRIAVTGSLRCTGKSAKDFLSSAVDVCLNRLIRWVDNKLSV